MMNSDNLFQLHEVREPSGNVPAGRGERDRILCAVRDYIADNSPGAFPMTTLDQTVEKWRRIW